MRIRKKKMTVYQYKGAENGVPKIIKIRKPPDFKISRFELRAFNTYSNCLVERKEKIRQDYSQPFLSFFSELLSSVVSSTFKSLLVAYTLHFANTACISAGSSESNCISFLVVGCTNPSDLA